MAWAEVEKLEGVSEPFGSLIRLWKCVEKVPSQMLRMIGPPLVDSGSGFEHGLLLSSHLG